MLNKNSMDIVKADNSKEWRVYMFHVCIAVFQSRSKANQFASSVFNTMEILIQEKKIKTCDFNGF